MSVERAPQDPPAGDPVVRNIRAVAHLERAASLRRPLFVRFCDHVTHRAGSTWSIAAHAAWFATWMGVNVLGPRPFDPFPFSLLTSVVSLEAIFLTLFVLASQNRLTVESDKRAHLDLQVNLLAEQEMTLVMRMLRDLCIKSHVDVPEALDALLADIDIETVAERVEEELPADEVSQAGSASPRRGHGLRDETSR
jgi:uncharacterized membrane protein